jgi:hypothetical protein
MSSLQWLVTIRVQGAEAPLRVEGPFTYEQATRRVQVHRERATLNPKAWEHFAGFRVDAIHLSRVTDVERSL